MVFYNDILIPIRNCLPFRREETENVWNSLTYFLVNSVQSKTLRHSETSTIFLNFQEAEILSNGVLDMAASRVSSWR